MRQNLLQLKEILGYFNNDVKVSNDFYGRHGTNVVIEDSKFEVIYKTLAEIEQSNNPNLSQEELAKNVRVIGDKLNHLYSSNQHFTWPSHSVHFHVDIVAWINCPMTCLYEIEEFVGKVLDN